MNHVVVFFANGFGDHFMSTPTLRAIQNISCRRLTFLWPTGLKQAFFTSLEDVEYREFKFYTRRGSRRIDTSKISDGLSYADAFVCLQPWYTNDIGALIQDIAPKQTIGFHERFDVVVKIGEFDHYVDNIFRLATTMSPSVKLSHFSKKPSVSDICRAQARPILATLPYGTRILAWHADTKVQKQWNSEKFASVLLRFLDDHEDYFAIGVGFNNADIRRVAKHGRLIGIDGLPLSTNLGILAASDLFLGIDSCMLHAADLLRIPGVGLYGPPREAPGGSDTFGFRFGPHVHISGQGSMESIREAEVLHALTDLMRATSL